MRARYRRSRGPAGRVGGRHGRGNEAQFIESTAGQVAAELARRGVAADQRVTIAIEPDGPDDWIAKARSSRGRG